MSFNMPPSSAGFPPRGRWLIDRLAADLGIAEHQAAGIVGNLGYESGGLTRLHEIGQPEGVGGYGWGQWTASRRMAFLGWCTDHGLDWRSDEANYGYLLVELTGKIPRYDFRYVVTMLKGCATVEDAVFRFGETYERPGGTTATYLPAFDERLAYAKRALSGAATPVMSNLRPVDIGGLVSTMSLAVRALQTGLRDAGFDPGPIDGIFGDRTDAALKAWKRAHR